MTWTDERVEIVRTMWANGESASAIARCIGGVTRNAVIGIIHRRRFACQVRKNQVIYRAARGRPPKPRLQPKPAPAQALRQRLPTAPLPISNDIPTVQLLDMEPHHCRFPCGEPTAGFCGAPKAPGLSYCEAHALRCYQAAGPRRSAPTPTPARTFARWNNEMEVAV